MSLIVYKKPKSPASEAFRIMRTNVSFANFDKKIKKILVTSSNPGEGKTAIATNLAATIASEGKRVLIIDADMRNPKVAKKLGYTNSHGLSNIIAGHDILENIVWSGYGDNLDVLTSGPNPPNPSEMLGSSQMGKMLEEAEKTYDTIIIDSPPLIAVTDPAVLSTYADGVLIVVESGETDIDQAIHSKKLLENVNANILGVVLNKAPAKVRGYYAYYYSQYYGYGDIKDKGKRRPRTKKLFKWLRKKKRSLKRRD